MSATDTKPTKPRQSFAHRLYTGDFEFEFIGNRKRWYTISAIVLLISFLAVGIRGLNLGIEFEGGSVFQAPVQVTSSTVDEFARAVSDTGVPDLGVQVNTVGDTTVRVQTRSLEAAEVVQVREAIAGQAGIVTDDVAYSLIGPSWGQQISQQALTALVVFLVGVGILIFLYFREWKMSVAALVVLLHDLVVTVGLYALIGFTVTPATVIAVLGILGYSLYDTVVVFDMTRVQTRDITSQSRTYSQATNAAINQVLVRSINTTIVAVLPVTAILVAGVVVLGGEGPLADLGLAMLIGMLSGAYSSLFLAAPLLAQMRERDPEMVKHRASLEKNRRKGRARISTVTSDAEVSVSGLPMTPTPSAGVLEFAETGIEVSTVDQTDDEPAPEPGSGERLQPTKRSRSARKK
ncbi:MAG: protein translocase subunit SecF [Brooklawnia sp.]|jgi:preprotein translocase subunit SecF